MSAPSLLLPCLARAAAKNLPELESAGLGGALLADAWDGWQRQAGDGADATRELQALVDASGKALQDAVAEAVQAEAGHLAPPQQQRVAAFLTQVPAALRRSLRRPDDPAGRTLPADFALRRPDDLSALLPDRLPRFQAGDRPLPGVDWELEELLGVGGFGEVWKAKSPYFDGVKPVALKFCTDNEARQQLLHHEAKVLNQVLREGNHPGIVPLLRTYLSADPPCLEYEYVPGGDLAGLVLEWRRAGEVHPKLALAAVRSLAEAVGFAHRLSPPVIHRDLKPSNVLVQRQEDEVVYRITDFGIGGLAARQAELTRAGAPTAARGGYTPLYS